MPDYIDPTFAVIAACVITAYLLLSRPPIQTTGDQPMTDTETLTDHDVLRQLARQFVEKAEQAPTFTESDSWHADAAMLRFVAQLIGDRPTPEHAELARLWINAARHMLQAYRPGDVR